MKAKNLVTVGKHFVNLDAICFAVMNRHMEALIVTFANGDPEPFDEEDAKLLIAELQSRSRELKEDVQEA